MREVISKFNIQGSSKVWVVQKYSDNTFSCNCPAWLFHKGQKVNCKHIKEVINSNMEYYKPIAESTLSITGIIDSVILKQQEKTNESL
jgi:hypothetical protein